MRAEGLITHMKLTLTGVQRLWSPSPGPVGLLSGHPGRGPGRKPLNCAGLWSPGSATTGPPRAGQPSRARPALCLRDWWPRRSPDTG